MLLLLPLVVMLSGCSKTDDAGQSDFIANAGALHNELLDHYYHNRPNATPGTEELISDVVTLSSEYLRSNGYDRRSVSEAASLLQNEYCPTHLKSVMNQDYSIDVDKLAEEITGIELYSNQFVEDVSEIIAMVADEEDIREVSTFVNSAFASVEYALENDSDGQSLFVNIFNSSYAYWTDGGSSDLKRMKLDDRSKVIINDGIGGILGLVFGPAGSIITATVFSVATNEEISDD